jgi:hypothetical protein
MKALSEEMLQCVTTFREKVRHKIGTMPISVPGVTYIGNCAVVGSMAVGVNLCSSYYLPTTVKAKLIAKIDKTPVEKFPAMIEKVLITGKIGGEIIHPAVLAAIKTAWEDTES